MQTLYSQLAKYFDVIAEASSVDTTKEVTFLETIFAKYNVHSVLDIACGTGRHSTALAEKGYEVTGVDYSDELLKIARGKSNLPNIRFVQQDVANIKLERTFDAAICMWSTFGELPYKEMLGRLKDALNSNGIFVIDVAYFAAVPTGTSHKTYTNSTDGVTIQTEIDESYTGITRIRDISNVVNGETHRDHSEMDVLTETDFVELLAQYGFQHAETHYDYSPKRQEVPKRIQLVFGKQD
jgi:SAM-dependent methyltransferase